MSKEHQPLPGPEYESGTPAPESGSYAQLNVFGSPTGHHVTVEAGVPLPPLPRGFSWRLTGRRDD